MPRSSNAPPDQPERRETVSLWLLTLSLIPLAGLVIAIALGLNKGFRSDDGSFRVRFLVFDYRSLTTCLTIIGLFHSLVNYCLQRLASRAADQIRTRAYLDGTSFKLIDILNTLPGSPDWKANIKSKLGWKLLVIGTLYASVAPIGGVLYKQGLLLSTFETKVDQNLTFTFMTNCPYTMTGCSGSRYLQYGVAMSLARAGGEFSTGIETIGNARRVAYVAAPTALQLTSAHANTTRIHAKSLAMVADYRNVSSDETLPIPRTTINTLERRLNVSVAFHGTDDLDWSVSVQHSTGTKPYQTVQGKTLYCVAFCEWLIVDGKLTLQKYTIHDLIHDCTRPDLGFWSLLNDVESNRSRSFAGEMGSALTSDLIDGNWNTNTTYDDIHDVLQSAFVIPAMYAVLVLGNYANYYRPVWRSNVTGAIANSPSPTRNGTHYSNTWTIEAGIPLVIYLVILLAIFLVHWISGFVDRKTYVTEWAPLWMGLLTDYQQEQIRGEIRKSIETITAARPCSTLGWVPHPK